LRQAGARADGLRRPGPSGRKAGGAVQFRVATEAGLSGGSARAKRLESDLRRLGRLPARRAPRRFTRSDRWSSVGDGGVDPVRAKLPDVAGIVPVSVVVMIERIEREIGSGITDGRREHDEKHK